MVKLNTQFNDEEIAILKRYGGEDYIIMSMIEGESYVLSDYGKKLYNECFTSTTNEFFMKQKYEKVIPYRMIQLYHYFLMESLEEAGTWYRGRKDKSGNWEYECYCDNLQEVLESL